MSQPVPPRAVPLLGVVGDLVEDIVVWFDGEHRYATDNPSRITRTRGGSGANVAAIAAAGTPTRFIGCVGTDSAGSALVEELAAHGVDVRVQRRGRTGTIVVLVDRSGERTMFPDRAAAAELTDVSRDWLDGLGLIHAPSYCFSAQPAAGATIGLLHDAADAGIDVSLDASSTGLIEELGVRRYLELVDDLRPALFFANAHEARLLDLGRPEFAKALTVVKDGPRPTTVRVPGGLARSVPVPPVSDVRDSTGAGDAFAAGFLAAHLRGADPVRAAEAGHRTARTVLRSPGANAARPHPEPIHNDPTRKAVPADERHE